MIILKKHFNNLFKIFFISVATLGILFLHSEYIAYSPKPFQHHGSIVEPFKNKGVYITATVYNSSASKKYLDNDLLSYGYQPIQITVQNNTENTFLFSKKGIDLPTASSKEIVSLITLGALPRAIAFKIVSFFFWPFIIASTIDTIRTLKIHGRLKRDFEARSVKENKEAIPPYATVHRVLFVPIKEYRSSFKKNVFVKLQDAESKSMYAFPINIYSLS